MYQKFQFNRKSKALIEQCNKILESYHEQGFDLTLRQLYYQLVSQNIIVNDERSYKNIGVLINKGRLAGLIDWNFIVDRARYLRRRPNWDSPLDILSSCAGQFTCSLWEEQDYSPEIWVEKEALIGIAERVGLDLDVPYYTCKGFNSQSEMWSAAQRFRSQLKMKKTPVVFYLGDHDPSGLDMSRDLQDRVRMFGANIEIKRIALNIEQVEELDLPANPAKSTDTRYKEYEREFGEDSWELDALNPTQLVKLIEDSILEIADEQLFEEARERQKQGREVLTKIVNRYDDVVEYLET